MNMKHVIARRRPGRWLMLSTAAFWSLASGCAGRAEPAPATQSSAPRAAVTTLRVPDGGLQPQVMQDSTGALHLLYYKGDPRQGDIFYVRSSDGGASFSTPLRVNSQPGSAIAMGNIRGAQLALGQNNRVHVAWNGSGAALPKGLAKPGKPAGAPMLYTRLNEDGTAFEPQRNLMQNSYDLDGGGSVAADQKGNVYVAWHGAMADKTREANRLVWIARSSDGGQTFERETSAWTQPTGACGCCSLRVYTGADGRVFLLYRAATEDVDRDMYLLTSNDAGKSFQGRRIHPWKLEACPMSTAALLETADQTGKKAVMMAWETEEQVYATRLDAASAKPLALLPAPGRGPVRKYPALAANARGEMLFAWAEGMGWNKGGAVAWQVFDQSGKPLPNTAGRAAGVPTWSLVAAFTRPDGTFTVVY